MKVFVEIEYIESSREIELFTISVTIKFQKFVPAVFQHRKRDWQTQRCPRLGKTPEESTPLPTL